MSDRPAVTFTLADCLVAAGAILLVYALLTAALILTAPQ